MKTATQKTTFPNQVLSAIILLACALLIASCSGRKGTSGSDQEAISGQSEQDSLVILGNAIPSDAPPPPPPPPPLPYNINEGDTIWFRPEVQAVYPGGNEQLMQFISKKIMYPESAKKSKTTGRVVVGFNIGKDCKITDLKIINSVSKDLDNEALRVISLLPSYEKPAMVNNHPVISNQWVPVHFELE